jgi:hypothetical protein
MSIIHLIETVPGSLKAVKSYLTEMDASSLEFPTVADSVNSGELPDLVVLTANNDIPQFHNDINALKDNGFYAKIPRIIIIPTSLTKTADIHEVTASHSTFTMPVDRLQFLSTASQFLKRSPRRVFRILISIQLRDSNIRYSGVSIDFSESGMSFESPLDIPKNQEMSISFVNPKNRKRFSLNAIVARRASTQPGGSNFYGVTFNKLSSSDAVELMRFITGES